MELYSRPDPSQSQTEANCAPENDDETRSFTASPIITVIAGPEKKIYRLHRKLLVEKSPFFANCLNSRMRESFTNEIVLPEDSYCGFEIVADWIYHGTVRDIMHRRDAHPAIFAYGLADKYCMPLLQNALLDSLGAYWTRNVLGPSTMNGAAKIINDDSPLYRFMVTVLAHWLVHKPRYYRRLSDIWDEDEATDDTDTSVRGWPEGVEKLLARPGLSSQLLWKVVNTKKGDANPAASPEKYHVAVESKSDREGEKRKADEGTFNAAPSMKRPRVILGPPRLKG